MSTAVSPLPRIRLHGMGRGNFTFIGSSLGKVVNVGVERYEVD